MALVRVFDVITILIGLFVFVRCAMIIKKNPSVFLFFVFFFLFILPLALDCFLGAPSYNLGPWYGYTLMQEDVSVSLVYDLFILLISLFFGFFFLKRKTVLKTKVITNPHYQRALIILLWITAAIAPCLFFFFGVVFKYNPLFVFNFGWRYLYDLGKFTYKNLEGYGAAERISYIGCTAGIVLLALPFEKGISRFFGGDFPTPSRRMVMMICAYFTFSVGLVGMNVLVEGKRSILLFVLIVGVIVSVNMLLGRMKTKTLLVSGGLLLCIAIPALLFLSQKYRTGGALDPLTYTKLRVDYFRDQSLKYAIFSSFHNKEAPLLSFPFQSYLTEFFYLFPLVYLPVSFKCGYETYLTASVLFSDISNLTATRYTNSGLDEMVANFSLFGFLLFMILLFFLLKHLAKAPPIERTFLMVAFVLFFMYTTSYICWFFEFLVLFKIFDFVLRKAVSKKGPLFFRGVVGYDKYEI